MKGRVEVSRESGERKLRAPKPPVYPFAAIVGQEEMKLALLLNVIDASIGGVLIMGHRGTGKSTAVRGLADLLPKIERVRGCLYGCDPQDQAGLCDDCHRRLASGEKLQRERAPVPVVELPLGATEDRVCGTLNIERALKEGVRAFEPGLLARANRGFLYIDEVNLLEDHLVDLLLDVSATGRNVVEREGVSIEHAARFRLVGSGNPEEGELRPQLLDRFGLHVEVRTAGDVDERVMIVEQRQLFERDPDSFRARMEAAQDSLRRKLARARKNLERVELSRELLRRIVELCQRLQVDGHRGELTVSRAARALAALEGRKAVTETDVRRVALMALRHRLRRDPLEQTSGGARIEQHLNQLFPPSDAEEPLKAGSRGEEDEPDPSSPKGSAGGNGAGRSAHTGANPEGGRGDDTLRDAPPALEARMPEVLSENVSRSVRGQAAKTYSSRRSAHALRTRENPLRGRYVRAVSARSDGARIALDATLRAIARDGGWSMGVREETRVEGLSTSPILYPLTPIPQHALRFKRYRRKAGTLFIFAVDTSGSMALNRIAQAKGALVRLLEQSYVRRDRVALVHFRGAGAEVLLRPSGSITRARNLLDTLGVGGATPLAAGMACALEVAHGARRQAGAARIILLLFTDGRANVSLRKKESPTRAARQHEIEKELERLGAMLRKGGVEMLVVDTQNRFTSAGEGRKLAGIIGGRHVTL